MLEHFTAWVIMGAVALAAVVLQLVILASIYHKAAPDEALIVYGFRGSRMVVGGGTVIFPLVENYRKLSLELMTFEVAPEQSLHTAEGAIMAVKATAQIKVKPNPDSIHAAAEWFLTKTLEQREELIRQMMESHLRSVVARLTVEQMVRQPERLAELLREACAVDIDRMGMEMVSFRIKEIREENSKG